VTARIGVVTFPGTLDAQDAARAVTAAGGEAGSRWHAARYLRGVDAVILPGGFSYGDYLRAGALARFAPVMASITAAARTGMPVLGICNGFQVLCESHLLPGALIGNVGRRFVCKPQRLVVRNAATAWTNRYRTGQDIVIPVKNMDGCFVADPRTLEELEDSGRIVVKYIEGNPNGSYRNIAGITNAEGNVVGLMPHPEHAIDSLTGTGTDGLGFFTSAVRALVSA
jgi:phosphoribosylformylglycinamidine synthase